jgi:hypothetical protein
VPITTENGYASRAGDNFSDIYFTANAKVTFTNASGQSSIVSPTQLSEYFEGGNFFVPATSNPIRPVNFMSYVDNWNAKIQECPDTTSTLAVFENNYFVSCNIHNTQLSHTNKFHYQNEVLTYSNPDNVTKTITFNSAIDAANATYQYSVSSLQVNANDSVGAAVINTNQFKIINYGNTTSYAVSIFYASVSDVTTFNHDAITFGEGSTHIIAPFYDNLNGNGIAIFVDNNSNGVFDDTLFVDNQAPPKLKLGTKFKNIPYGSGVYTVPIANIGGGSLSWQLNNTASWLTINSPMNGIEDGSIQFNADNNSGNYRIGFIIINSNDPNKPIDTLIVAQDGITALENASIVSEISAFPNPTYGLLFIKVPTDNRIKEITLISIDGKQYTVSEFNTEGLSGIHKFDMQHVQSGIYILRVQLSDTTVYDKIIKY